MNAIRIKPGGVPVLIIYLFFSPRGFELLPSQSFAVKFSQTSLSNRLLCCFLAALHLLAQGRQPACHCIQSPTKLFYHLFCLVLQIAFILKGFLCLSYCCTRGTLRCCMSLPCLKVRYLCLSMLMNVWLNLAANSHYMLKLNPHPIFARDKLAQVKFQVLLIVGKCIWRRPEFVL